MKDIGGNTIDEIFNCTFDVIEGGPESLHALFSGETHRHQLSDFCLIRLLLSSLLSLRFGSLLGYFLLGLLRDLLLLFLFWWFGLYFFLGFWLWLLRG